VVLARHDAVTGAISSVKSNCQHELYPTLKRDSASRGGCACSLDPDAPATLLIPRATPVNQSGTFPVRFSFHLDSRLYRLRRGGSKGGLRKTGASVALDGSLLLVRRSPRKDAAYSSSEGAEFFPGFDTSLAAHVMLTRLR
jgi:hypothetical protein